jgi:hypothetical protein
VPWLLCGSNVVWRQVGFLVLDSILIVLHNNVDIEFGEQFAQSDHQGSGIMRGTLAQSQDIAEEALIMLLRDSMFCEDFVVCGEEGFDWGVW